MPIRAVGDLATLHNGYVCHHPRPNPAERENPHRSCSVDLHLTAFWDDPGKWLIGLFNYAFSPHRLVLTYHCLFNAYLARVPTFRTNAVVSFSSLVNDAGLLRLLRSTTLLVVELWYFNLPTSLWLPGATPVLASSQIWCRWLISWLIFPGSRKHQPRR